MKISFEDWEHTCGDNCCYEWGTDMYIDGQKVDEHFNDEYAALRWLIRNKLNLNVEFEGYEF